MPFKYSRHAFSQILLIGIGILILSCDSQNNRIEIDLQNCIFNTFPDNGKKLKNSMNNFERYLIESKILKNNTGEGYLNIYKEIAEKNSIDYNIQYSFLDSIKTTIPDFELTKINNCQNEILQSESYKGSKIFKLEKALDTIGFSNNISPSIVANEFLKVLDKNDFELDYYKFRVLILLHHTNVNSIIKKANIEEEYDLDKVITVNLNEKSEIIVNNKIITLQKLQKLISNYVSQNKKESVILFITTKETKYGKYIQVQNTISIAIENLWQKNSIKKYGTDFQNLTEEQQSEILYMYPKKIVEKSE